MPIESELWCLTLTSEERAIAGRRLAEAIGVEVSDPVAFFNKVNDWVFQFAGEAAQESRDFVPSKIVRLFPD